MSAPAALKVAVGREPGNYDYFLARRAGVEWPTTEVAADTEWREHVVSLSQLMPTEPAEAASQRAFYIAFVVDHPEPIELWMDSVQLE